MGENKMNGLVFRFELPPVWALYVYKGNVGEIYVFGNKDAESEIEAVLEHETLHWVVHKLAGTLATEMYDNVAEEVEKH